MAAPARAAAFRVLGLIGSEQVDLGEALRRARDPLEDARDRALATDLAIGTLRWRGAIDFQLQRLSARPLARLDAEVLNALRLAAYQLLYRDRLPVSAVVNDSVSLVKASKLRSAAGFANAVLRRLAGERGSLPWPPRPADAGSRESRAALVEHLAVVHSHPAWLVDRWLSRYGVDDTERWLRFNNQTPRITVAANRLRVTREELAAGLAAEGLPTEPTVTAPHGLVVLRGRLIGSQAFTEGLCVVQDEASQVVAELVAGADGDRVLDACASPGGKTLALAAQVGPAGMVVAADVRGARVALLDRTMRRTGARGVSIVQVPVRGALPFPAGSFDRVLVDAPCSGLGTVRRDPDIRWRRTAADLEVLAEAQRNLLSRSAEVVAPGGRLVYSTCSSEFEENEAVVADFLARTSAFAVVPLGTMPTVDPRIRALATADGFLRTDPRVGLEAFFGAVLERAGG